MKKLSLIALGMTLAMAPASAQIPNKIKIGVLSDMSGPVSDVAGIGSVTAARLAIEEHAKSILGPNVEVEVVQGDHTNKADTAAAIARRWLDTEGVNVIADVPFSAAALSVNEVVRGNGKAVLLVSGGGTVDLRVFATEAEQAAAMGPGTRRLLRLSVPSPG